MMTADTHRFALTLRLAPLALSAMVFAACADGCGCGGEESPYVPESVDAGATFDATSSEVRPSAPTPTAVATGGAAAGEQAEEPADESEDAGTADAPATIALPDGGTITPPRNVAREVRMLNPPRAIGPIEREHGGPENSIGPALRSPALDGVAAPPTRVDSEVIRR